MILKGSNLPIKFPLRNDADQPFSKLYMYAMGANPSQQPQPAQPQQPVQAAQAATLAAPQASEQPAPQAQPAPQPAAPAPQPITPVVPPLPQAGQQFGQPQQPQPAQPRQTTMTQNTAAQRYNQMLQQNVPQAQAVSSGLAQVIENPATQAKRKLDAAQEEFRNKVSQSGLTRNAGRTTDLISKAAALKAGQTLTPEEFAELQKISSTKGSFGEGVRDTDFVALQNYVQALGQADQAKQLAGLTESTTDRQGLLNKLVDDRQYTEGQSLMDSLLAGGVQPANAQLGGIRKELVADDLLGKLASDQQKRATGARDVEKSEVESAYKDIQDMLDAEGTGKLSGQEKSIRDKVASENARAKDLNARIESVLKNKGSKFGDNDVEKNLIAELGLSKHEASQIQAAGPNASLDIINKLKDASEQTMTSADELARLNQLYKIGDLTGRQGQRITAQEGSDLGSLIGQKAGINREALNRATTENSRAAETKRKEFNQAALETPIKDYRFGGGTSTKNAAIDIYDRMRTGGFRDDIDNPEADKVIANMRNALQKTTNAYDSMGLSFDNKRFEPSANDINDTFAALWKNSHVAKMPMTGQQMYNGNINELKAKDPKTYNRMYQSALKMAQIKKLAEYNNFFNEFRHQKK